MSARENPNNTIRELRAERDAALAAIARVRAIHRPTLPGYGPKACVHDGRGWPCETMAALDGAPEKLHYANGAIDKARAEAWEEGADAFEDAWKSDHLYPHNYLAVNPYREETE